MFTLVWIAGYATFQCGWACGIYRPVKLIMIIGSFVVGLIDTYAYWSYEYGAAHDEF